MSGIEEGNRLPTCRVPGRGRGTYQWPIAQSWLGYLTGTYQHIGSRFTQSATSRRLRHRDCLVRTEHIGGPLHADTFTFDPELPAYDLVNLRVGLLNGPWDLALYVNNLTDERALLSLDQERGTRARVGYLTNQPRTFGITARFSTR